MANLLSRLLNRSLDKELSEALFSSTDEPKNVPPWMDAARGLARRGPLQLDVYIVSLCQQLYSSNASEVFSALMQLDTIGFHGMGRTQRRRVAISTAVMNAVFRPSMNFEHGQLATIRTMGMRVAFARLAGVLGARKLGTMFWEGMDFRGASFSGIELASFNFRKCIFENVNFSVSTLKKVRFVECAMAGATMLEAVLQDVDFSLCDLSAANLYAAAIRNTRMQSCNLSRANLATSVVEKSIFAGSEFTGATLRGARLKNCDFSGVEGLEVHMLQEADFTDVLFVAPPTVHFQ